MNEAYSGEPAEIYGATAGAENAGVSFENSVLTRLQAPDAYSAQYGIFQTLYF